MRAALQTEPVVAPLPMESAVFSARTSARAVSDRRRQMRFPLAVTCRYWLKSGKSAEGVLVNISSRGVLFHAEAPLAVGKMVQLSIPWPTLLHETCPLQLRIEGRVIRNSGSGTAAKIERYAFHTATRAVASAASAMAGLA